jgi:predicted GNAT superfamily acetyltransferase
VPRDDAVEIRELKETAELQAVEVLQQKVWGFRSRAVVPHHVLYVAATYRGIVLGAYMRGKLVGFTLGFLGQRDGKLCHVSHMLGVLPAYRGRGIGEALKWRQRERALAQGVELMTWTFDPLEAGNAHLNLHKLGALSRTYFEDLYGDLDNRLNGGLPTDRLLAEWDLRAPRTLLPASGTSLIDVEGDTPQVVPERLEGSDAICVPVPQRLQTVKRENRRLALAWRLAVRDALESAFAAGYVARDFIDSAYILMRGEQ